MNTIASRARWKSLVAADDQDRDDRVQVPGGIWQCGSSPCARNTKVQDSMSSAQFVSILY